MKRDLSLAINKKTLQTLIVTSILAMSTFVILSMQVQRAYAAYSSVEIIPELLEYGPENATGQEFIIEAYVRNVTNLYGIDIQFAWDPEYLLYLNHTPHIPKDDYTDGILWKPGMFIFNDVDATAGTYWVAYACMDPAPAFNGTGIAFDMAFRILKHPVYPDPDVTLTLDLVATDLSDKPGYPIPHDKYDGAVVIHALPYDYPPKPMLKIMPETVDAPTGTQFNSSVIIMGEDGGDLDPFWDVAGFDVYMNFRRTEAPYVIIEALDVTLDPDGSFAAFWPNGIFEIDDGTINNAEGWVHVAFMGLPGVNATHTAPDGTFSIFKVRFNATYGGTPELTTNITLKNPYSLVHRMNLHSDDGLIELTTPLDTEWHAINAYDYGAPINLYAWTDTDGDGQLSSGDEIMLNNTSSGVWHHYITNEIKGTLGPLEQQPFPAEYDCLAMDGPTNKYTPWPKIADTGLYTNGWGNPNWTGNFSCTYPVSSVDYFEVQPQIGAPYNLTEGVDFIVNPDGTIDLITALDERVENEYVGNMTTVDKGWPAIAYIASGFESVWIDMHNGTQRYARNYGYAMSPPAEYWYDYDFPYEIESWWATGYYPGSWVWPNATDIYINYSAPAFIHIDYNAVPDLRPNYIEFNGTYAEFLTALSDPVGTGWDEAYPNTMQYYNFVEWSDIDTSGDITIGDYITLEGTIGNRTFLVNGKATDIIVDQILTVDDVDQRSPFYGETIIAGVAGFPHPDRALSPWRSSSSSMPLPHDVEDASAVIPEFPASFTLVLSLMTATIIALLMKPKPKKTEK
jgi:hypothetical protein